MKIGIIGHGEDKFTEKTKKMAKLIIMVILREYLKNISIDEKLIVVSGHSPVGGIDIYAEEVAKNMGLELDLKIPRQHTWNAAYGYKQRNLDIAKDSDKLHVILVDKYPPNYKGEKFNYCYHCHTNEHIKSGACWTAKKAEGFKKKVAYHIIKNEK